MCNARGPQSGGRVNHFAAMGQTAGGARARASIWGDGVADVSAISQATVLITATGCKTAGAAGGTTEPARLMTAQMPQ